jgi:hypothetical protein
MSGIVNRPLSSVVATPTSAIPPKASPPDGRPHDRTLARADNRPIELGSGSHDRIDHLRSMARNRNDLDGLPLFDQDGAVSNRPLRQPGYADNADMHAR